MKKTFPFLFIFFTTFNLFAVNLTEEGMKALSYFQKRVVPATANVPADETLNFLKKPSNIREAVENYKYLSENLKSLKRANTHLFSQRGKDQFAQMVSSQKIKFFMLSAAAIAGTVAIPILVAAASKPYIYDAYDELNLKDVNFVCRNREHVSSPFLLDFKNLRKSIVSTLKEAGVELSSFKGTIQRYYKQALFSSELNALIEKSFWKACHESDSFVEKSDESAKVDSCLLSECRRAEDAYSAFTETCSSDPCSNNEAQELTQKKIEYDFEIILKKADNNPKSIKLYSQMSGYNICDGSFKRMLIFLLAILIV
jgi:hypothetical protein